MTIRVLYFASLRERLGRGADELAQLPATVLDAWRAGTGEGTPPPGVLCAVNQDYSDWDAPLRDGDEVAFFPPVTGG
jgi:sulfur-carrier protein